ncbi:hypothetical protein BLD44_028180 [Mastigocladus laminosus UU774]|jgi:hypothetical protein|nr:hypothetical protein B4U84_02540 [Westiellopsis prolifica IICB1]TFI51050.1 hypothetical protein BLD44_028180 [Mastigocladus laminosus UU774]
MTAQVCERLIFNGEIIPMAFRQQLLEQKPRVMKLNDQNINIDNDSPLTFSTTCWRFQIGTWEIKNGQLYLVDVFGFYKMLGKAPIPANWFTGVIKIPQGKLLRYVHMGFGSVYEQEIHVTIKNGKVIQSRAIDNLQPSCSSFDDCENLYDHGDNGW